MSDLKFCRDCKWFVDVASKWKRHKGYNAPPYTARCLRPELLVEKDDYLVSGDPTDAPWASWVRRDKARCGVGGTLFEPRP